jgi:actin-related protein
VLVVDLGSNNTTVGWAGELKPVKTFSTIVNNKRPIVQGFIKDLTAVEELFKQIYAFFKLDPVTYPISVTVPPKTSPANKAKLAKLLFDKLSVPSVMLVSSAYSALCSTEFLSGLVLNVGAGVTHAVPIYEANVLHHGIQRLDVSGNDLTEALIKPITSKGHMVSTEDVNTIKEGVCRISLDADAEVKANAGKPFTTAFLTDGRQFPVFEEVVKVPEALFAPRLLQKDGVGVAELVKKAINQCDLDVRRSLWENILLAGGSSMFPGFTERLEVELKKLAPENTVPVLNIAPNRMTNTWIGASTMAMAADFFDQCVSSDEFAEGGETVFQSKCVL